MLKILFAVVITILNIVIMINMFQIDCTAAKISNYDELVDNINHTDHILDTNNAVYLPSELAQGNGGGHSGKVVMDPELLLWITDNTKPKEHTDDQVYRIVIRSFISQEYSSFIRDEYWCVRRKYLNIDVGEEHSYLKAELLRFCREWEFRMRCEGYRRYMKPILDEAKEFGLVFEEKRIDFLTKDDKVNHSELFVVAYADKYLIERFSELIEGKEYGFRLDLAPPYVDYDSPIYANDPWRNNTQNNIKQENE